MLKRFLFFVSLFTTISARNIGSDPKTWSPKCVTDVCDQCKTIVTLVEADVCQFVPEQFQDWCKDLLPFVPDPEIICEEIKIC